MANANDDGITRWLERSRDGDAVALGRLPPGACAHFRRITSSALGSPTGHGTSQTIAFVDDVVWRLFGRPLSAFESRVHLIGVSSRRGSTDKRESKWVSHDFMNTLPLPIPEEATLAGLDATLGGLEFRPKGFGHVVEFHSLGAGGY